MPIYTLIYGVVVVVVAVFVVASPYLAIFSAAAVVVSAFYCRTAVKWKTSAITKFATVVVVLVVAFVFSTRVLKHGTISKGELASLRPFAG